MITFLAIHLLGSLAMLVMAFFGKNEITVGCLLKYLVLGSLVYVALVLLLIVEGSKLVIRKRK
jgi:hypothetical protein